jgi:hypothetical protein
MDVGLLAAGLGLLIAAACIALPQVIRVRRQRTDDDDTQAYLKATGRTAEDIAQGNALLRERQSGGVFDPAVITARSRETDGSKKPAR